MEAKLIAPCGFNCGICKSHLRKYKKCLGCNNDELKKSRCVFHICEILKTSKSCFCFECEKFPCEKLEKGDKKHREHDGVSMIENLNFIKNHGVDEFLKKEKEKWKCPECGGLVCVGAHVIICSNCGYEVKRLGLMTQKRRK